MLEFSHIIYEIVIGLFLVYGTAVTVIYGWIGIYALGAVLRYKKENTFTDYSIRPIPMLQYSVLLRLLIMKA